MTVIIRPQIFISVREMAQLLVFLKMDILWMLMGALLVLAGIVGSVAPVLPGPPLAYGGLLMLQLQQDPPFTTRFLLIWAGIVIVVTVLDYVIPMYGTKKFGGSKYGMWGCTIGLFVGLWFGPIGVILGPFVGAFVGEMLASNNSDVALRAAIGSFIGFLFSTLLKLMICFAMAYYFIVAVI
jgi:uncharacterized protein YqgC (DUF456 family)